MTCLSRRQTSQASRRHKRLRQSTTPRHLRRQTSQASRRHKRLRQSTTPRHLRRQTSQASRRHKRLRQSTTPRHPRERVTASRERDDTPLIVPLNAAGLARVLRRRMPYAVQTELVARVVLTREFPQYAHLHDEAMFLFLTGLVADADRE